ncbi:hypothetical protein ACRALDRAFT_2061201 [Sodiomyces alcalophilus JCM 7366]|uniref:uncharacterized protein n=1 Tax=Sodiomyces alcalophilus JCM 7366 TaxID=591952 RepID=UPI0039B5A128
MLLIIQRPGHGSDKASGLKYGNGASSCVVGKHGGSINVDPGRFEQRKCSRTSSRKLTGRSGDPRGPC